MVEISVIRVKYGFFIEIFIQNVEQSVIIRGECVCVCACNTYFNINFRMKCVQPLICLYTFCGMIQPQNTSNEAQVISIRLHISVFVYIGFITIDADFEPISES